MSYSRRISFGLSRQTDDTYRGFRNSLALVLLIAVGLGTHAQSGEPSPIGFLYALNEHSDGSSNQIYGFSVDETTGTLSLLPGFPVPTGGTSAPSSFHVEELVIDTTNQRLYAINDAADTVSAYAVDPMTGALTAMPFSPIALGAGSWNTVAIHASGSPLIVGDDSAKAVKSINVTATTAVEAAGSPYSTGTTSIFTSVFSRDGSYCYIGGYSGEKIAGFMLDSATGVLTALSGSPFNSDGTHPVALATDSQRRLFTSTASGERVFTTASGVPTRVTGNPFTPSLSTFYDGVLHPNERYYFVADRQGDRVASYRIDGSGASTTLTPVAWPPFPSGGAVSQVITMNQTGAFLFVGNSNSRNLSKFDVNPSTGFLGNLVVQPANTLGTSGLVTGLAYTNPSLVRTAISRKTHGTAGVFDINLPFSGTPGVESRVESGASSGDHQILVSFVAPVVSIGGVQATSGMIGGVAFSVNANVITVNLNGVTNAQGVSLGLPWFFGQ